MTFVSAWVGLGNLAWAALGRLDHLDRQRQPSKPSRVRKTGCGRPGYVRPADHSRARARESHPIPDQPTTCKKIWHQDGQLEQLYPLVRLRFNLASFHRQNPPHPLEDGYKYKLAGTPKCSGGVMGGRRSVFRHGTPFRLPSRSGSVILWPTLSDVRFRGAVSMGRRNTLS